MKDRGIIVTWETDGVTYHSRVSSVDNPAQKHLQRTGKLEGKVIVRMEVPAAKDKQYHYKGGIRKILVRAEELNIIGFYD